MPKFNIKDLMVSLDISKEAQICPLHTYIICHFGCSIYISQPCALHSLTNCPLHSCGYFSPGPPTCGYFSPGPPTCGISEISPYKDTNIYNQVIPALDVQELTELKTALQGLVEKIDKEFRPAKLEQLDSLEGKLNEAIKDVKEAKKKFS